MVLAGLTHAVVHVPYLADARATNTYALVDLCFGPGDDTTISGIRLTRDSDKKMIWTVPMYEHVQGGRKIQRAVLRGQLLVETTKLAAQAIARIKKDLGESAWGKRYTIFKDQIKVDDLPKE